MTYTEEVIAEFRKGYGFINPFFREGIESFLVTHLEEAERRGYERGLQTLEENAKQYHEAQLKGKVQEKQEEDKSN